MLTGQMWRNMNITLNLRYHTLASRWEFTQGAQSWEGGGPYIGVLVAGEVHNRIQDICDVRLLNLTSDLSDQDWVCFFFKLSLVHQIMRHKEGDSLGTFLLDKGVLIYNSDYEGVDDVGDVTDVIICQ